MVSPNSRETGNHYNYFRDYNPAIGRYAETDPIGIDRGENHLFGYVQNNPVNFTDPSGEFAIALPIICAGGGCQAAAGAVVGIGIAAAAAATGIVGNIAENLQETIERLANREEYKRICSEPPPPGLSGCELAKWKLNKAKRCKQARDENTKRWWGGQDNRHNPQLEYDLLKAIKDAEALVERLCKCPQK